MSESTPAKPASFAEPNSKAGFGLVAGKYDVLHLIGRGGMGSVWEGRHASLGTPVAIKFIDLEHALDEEARARFVTEARAAASIQSKHAIQIYDHGVTGDGRPYIVMELLVGEPLDRRLERLGRLSLQDTARMLAQVCRAVSRAHEAGIIHRDLKPENIFLCRSSEDDDEIAKVLDFGIAKIKPLAGESSPTSSTKTGAILGTPYYMSPEQARGLRNLDHRSDLWSLGVIAYKCVTGALPFDGQSMGDLLVNICTGEIPTPSLAALVVAELPASFDAWFARALARDPERRFPGARELADALAACAGLPERKERDVAVARRSPAPALAPTLGAEAAITSTPFTASAATARSSRSLVLGVVLAIVLGGAAGLVAMLKIASSPGVDAKALPAAIPEANREASHEANHEKTAAPATAAATASSAPAPSAASSAVAVPKDGYGAKDAGPSAARSLTKPPAPSDMSRLSPPAAPSRPPAGNPAPHSSAAADPGY